MTAQETETFTLNLMDQWGLTDKHWKFQWNSRKKAFGICNFKEKTIELSSYLWPAISEEEQKDTVKHELAHALDFLQRGYSDHGRQWKIWAMRLGAKPMACAKIAISIEEVQPSKYISICPNGHSFPSHRLRKRRTSCIQCNPHQFDERFVLVQRKMR